MFQSPGAIALNFGSIDIYWYGIIMSLSILAGLLVVIFLAKKYFQTFTTDLICDLSFDIIILGLICARLYYVILDYRYFVKYPMEVIAIWNGGIAIQGAIIGGILSVLLYAKEHKISFLKLADLFTFGLVTGQIIGRWGNFFNSEAFGLPCNLPWKLYIPYASRPLEYKTYEYFHPTFLYESLLNVVVLIILLTMAAKLKKRKNGVIFFSYLILYSIVRIIIETIRLDSVLSFGSVHFAHIASMVFIIAGLLGLFFLKKKQVNNN